MKVYVSRSYGSLHLVDLPVPVPRDGEVLVRVKATSVNPYDWHHLRGEPYVARLIPGTLGLRAPKVSVLGCDMAGRVEAVGHGVTGVDPGDDVYALLAGGGFGEYVCVPAGLLARKPANLSHEQAAAVPMAAVTALIALRDSGRLAPGQRVLVNGASGGVGTFAVQLAKAYGATVLGVCSGGNVKLVESIGADEVIDYQESDFTRRVRDCDLIVDLAGSRTPAACRRALTSKGTLVIVGGAAGRFFQPVGHLVAGLALGPLVSQRMVAADAVAFREKRWHLETLTGLIESGAVTPVVDRTFGFDELTAAVSYQEKGHARGKVVVAGV
jgi:NADPH:quinone reductase-like Zn-dependent oxidoreductase